MTHAQREPRVLDSVYWGPDSPLCVFATGTPNAVYCVGDTPETARGTMRTASSLCQLAALDAAVTDCTLAPYGVPLQSDGLLPKVTIPHSQQAISSAVVPVAADQVAAGAPAGPFTQYYLVNQGLTAHNIPPVVTVTGAGEAGTCPQFTLPAQPLYGDKSPLCLVRS